MHANDVAIGTRDDACMSDATSKAIKVKCNIVPLCPPGSASLLSAVQWYMHKYQAEVTTMHEYRR